MNGTDYTVGTGISAAYKVEVCDLNTSDNQLNIVVVGTGADNSVTSFRVLSGTDLSTPVSYTHLDVYKRQVQSLVYQIPTFLLFLRKKWAFHLLHI